MCHKHPNHDKKVLTTDHSISDISDSISKNQSLFILLFPFAFCQYGMCILPCGYMGDWEKESVKKAGTLSLLILLCSFSLDVTTFVGKYLFSDRQMALKIFA